MSSSSGICRPVDAGLQGEAELAVGLAIGNIRDRVAEEIDPVMAFRRARLQVDLACEQALLAGDRGRHQAQGMQAGIGRAGILVPDFQVQVVQHGWPRCRRLPVPQTGAARRSHRI